MASPNAAWGIEIGADALKALRLERDGTNVVVSDFAYIPHKKVLTTPDLDQDEMIRISLGQFISQQSLEGEHLVMSVPGHAAFARFAKLPPVEPKKVPDIVKFEAVQQIPFPIDEVEWDYETFTSDDSPEIEVGIFAITRERVQQRLGLYSELGISPESLTLSPVSVFNAMSYDLSMDESSGPVIFLDIGTQATDVVIAEQGRCWIRTFPLGGTHFTEAIASAFKLSYSKAEKLKKEAATSKYAKQIMQAMRPVFSDLLQDLQRSIGYYQSLHRDHDLTEMVGIGSTFKIPGLRKFIGQQLQINVQRLDEFKRISVGGREAASFAEHAVNMASVYGLALQGVGLAPIDANLVPVGALREHMWHAKTKWFAAAAAVIVAGAATTLYHPLVDGAALRADDSSSLASTVQALGEKEKNAYNALQSDVGATTVNVMALAEDREIWPALLADVAIALDTVDPSGALRGASIEDLQAVPPEERKLVLVKDLGGTYLPPDGQAQKTRQIAVTLNLELSHRNPAELLNSTVAEWLRENAEPAGDRADRPYRILSDSVGCSPTRREDIVVGERTARGSGSGTAPGASRRETAGGGSRPVRPPSGSSTSNPGGRRGTPDRQAPPGAGAGGGGGGNFGAAGGGGRRKTPDRMAPPGAGIGNQGGGPSGATGPGTGTGAGTPSGNQNQQRPSGETGQEGSPELDSIAPLPERPSIYPDGSTYYRLPITFTIEIIDAAPQMPVDPNA